MHKRAREDERRLQKISVENCSGYSFAGAYICNGGYLKRFSYGNKSYKRICTRKLRRKMKCADYLLQRGKYRKASEYEWMCW